MTDCIFKDLSPTIAEPVISPFEDLWDDSSSDDPWEDPTINSTDSFFSNSSFFFNSSFFPSSSISNSFFLTLTSLEQGDGFHNILGNNPETRPKAWVALGDSFAAGPGAGAPYGQDVGCMRGQNAYPPQMQRSDDMPGPDLGMEPSKPRFNFKACTGDVTQDLTDSDNPNYQLGAVSEDTSFLTLSIGGNDVKFSAVLKRCVYGILPIVSKTCDELIADGRSKLYSTDMYDNYNNVVSSALEKLRYERRWSKRTALYQTGYPQFFDSFTTQCDTVGFSLFAGPKITQELRRKLNRLTHEVNYVLQYWMDNINVRHTTERDLNSDYATALDWVDTDLGYTDHRFCRPQVTEPDRTNPDTWFFHANIPLLSDSAIVPE